MKKVWRRASGVIKDRTSLWKAAMARRSSLETAIIKATSHDERSVDYRNARRVFQWIRTSPCYVNPLVLSLSRRVSRTRSWAVALKSLILIHGVFCCDVPAVRRISRLPFDLSNFMDAYAPPAAVSAFVCAYFAFLDQRAAYLSSSTSPDLPLIPRTASASSCNSSPTPLPPPPEFSMPQELARIQKWQKLLDLLLQVKPDPAGVVVGDVVAEVMDCVTIEIFDIYSSICSGIASVLVRILAATSFEASVALRVLKKAVAQSEALSQYLHFCRHIGVLNLSDLPPVDRIPEDDIREVERIIAASAAVKSEDRPTDLLGDKNGGGMLFNKSGGDSKTVITDEWEVFEGQQGMSESSRVGVGNTAASPAASVAPADRVLPLDELPGAPWDETQPDQDVNGDDSEGLPDLITF